MVAGAPTEEGPRPPNLLPRQWSLLPPVVADGLPHGGDEALPFLISYHECSALLLLLQRQPLASQVSILRRMPCAAFMRQWVLHALYCG